MGLDNPGCDPRNPPAGAAAPASGQSQAGSAATLWEDYAKPRQEPPTRVKKEGEWTCPQHGSLCSPGICKERARFERDKRMRDGRKKREEERRPREARRAREQLKRERKEAKAMGEGGSELRERPPHLRGNASSRSDGDTSHNQGTVFL